MAAATASMAKVVVLLLLAMQILSVLAGAARPLLGGHGWMENGIEMVPQMLISQPNPNGGHCC
jgi:hypothetical protein